MSTINKIYHELKGDKIIWFIVFILGMFSILAVYSATGKIAYDNRGGDTTYYLVQQTFIIFMGFGVTYICYLLHYMKYSKLAPIFLMIAIPLMLYTVAFGVEIHDARRWINIPFINKTFQSSDFAKLALIIFVARSLSVKQDVIKDFKNAFLPIILPIILICFLIVPDDLSTAALLFLTCFLMMFVGRVSLKWLGVCLLLGCMALSTMYFIGKSYPDNVRVATWESRINDFQSDDGQWQVKQSKIAIANGGWTGVGPGNSMQRHYLPYAYADFIFAIICEEYGLFGGLFIIVLYLSLLFRCMMIVTRCPKTFGAILAMGLCMNLVIQALANIAVSVHLVPVTGLTLPLISRGGTSVFFTCVSFGIILSVSRYVEEAQRNKILLEQIEIRDADSV